MTEARSYFAAVFRRRVGVAAVRAMASHRIRSAAYIGMTRADVQRVVAGHVPGAARAALQVRAARAELHALDFHAFQARQRMPVGVGA